ncbi:hypothetical protein COCNU_01G005720 [Cocos nucifera]|uniref:NHL repeat-containing protein n=1 Tax=Cocos nucifera TaxID=13894 RepID=A0A8K0MUJ5_COCNU|nr:hypothetical protein COCNU_01G005720 [Cocos nucifera]
MEKKKGLALLLLMTLFSGFCSVSAASPATISSRTAVKFESGYSVETVFDGGKLGIEPFSVGVSPSGDLLLLDSANSNIYRISPPLSRLSIIDHASLSELWEKTDSRPKLLAGSAEGYTGYIDGRPREARMNHPKGFTVDDKGNIYVTDTMNKAIRKISDTGVTTIAGGTWNRGGHVDGPSEDAKFSNDFEVVYIGSSCSLLVVDRGNQAIREIQLHFDDCAYQYGTVNPLGIAVLFAAGFFGYMLALLQRRVGAIVSPIHEPKTPKSSMTPSPHQQPRRPSVRPPLIPTEDESAKQEEEGLFTSIGKLVAGAGSSIALIVGGIFSSSRGKYHQHHNQHQLWQQSQATSLPVQESFLVPEEDPPPVEARTPVLRKTYAFMSKDPEKLHQLRQGGAYFSSWDGELQEQKRQQQQCLHQHRRYSSVPHA